MNARATTFPFRRWVALAAAAVLLPAFASAQAPQDPGKLIDTVAKKVLRELDANRAEMAKEPQKIRKMVDETLLPHFDTEYSARQVLGLHWRKATDDQRKRFIEAFYQSLLQNYGEALLDFTPDRLEILPYKEDPDDKNRATVKTVIRRDNGSRVPVNYTLRKTEAGWKAWDVTIEGISYVKSFRTDFSTEIEQKGLDAVIKRLETQQASGKPTKKPTKK